MTRNGAKLGVDRYYIYIILSEGKNEERVNLKLFGALEMTSSTAVGNPLNLFLKKSSIVFFV